MKLREIVQKQLRSLVQQTTAAWQSRDARLPAPGEDSGSKSLLTIGGDIASSSRLQIAKDISAAATAAASHKRSKSASYTLSKILR